MSERLPIQLFFKYRPDEKLKKKAVYYPSAPFSLSGKVRELDPVSLLDYWWMFVLVAGFLFALIILVFPL